jgi:cyclic beta-1,2-glucan synthetase
MLTRPSLVREQILLHAAHQFEEGDVLHWWHPPSSKGIRTRFADDRLWLPWVTAGYLETTADSAILDESVRFITGPPVPDDEDEVFITPSDSGARADLYEHCCRAIDISLATGAHGLPLFGSGDWNDGMNRVGREGRGESVWMGFFLFDVLRRFEPWCERRGDSRRAAAYAVHRERLRAAIEEQAWDGAWYRRGWYDDGAVLGSRSSDECRIDALVQAWAVISKAAAPERCATALDSVERLLISDEQEIVRLLTPAFDRTPHDPGYIKGYVPGVRENGGQYTHAALWVVKAFAELGRHDRAARLLEMLSPIRQSRSPGHAAVYQVEPYVIAADVYGEPPHVRRGGWTWYTGSAGWMYRVAVETIFGLAIDRGQRLLLTPRVPAEWPGCSLGYCLPDGRTTITIEIRNPSGEGGHAQSATLDGAAVEVESGVVSVPLPGDRATHALTVVVGRNGAPSVDVGTRSRIEKA